MSLGLVLTAAGSRNAPEQTRYHIFFYVPVLHYLGKFLCLWLKKNDTESQKIFAGRAMRVNDFLQGMLYLLLLVEGLIGEQQA
jgi:hypothetical protein